MDFLLLALDGQDANLFLYFEVSDPVDLKHTCLLKGSNRIVLGLVKNFTNNFIRI